MKMVVTLLLAARAIVGQDQIGYDAAERAKLVTVMINAKVDDSVVPGAGIIFGLANGQVYIATANHLVRRGLSEAADIHVEFRWLPGQPIRAQLLTNYDPLLDLAVIVVDSADARANQVGLLSFDRLGNLSQLALGMPVWAIGYPNGSVYDIGGGQFNQMEGVQLKYHAMGLVPGGYSGGPLVDSNGSILGIIRQDQPPNAVATRIDLVIDQLKAWSYRVALRAVAPKPARTFEVRASQFVTSTTMRALAGERFTITAHGSVNLADRDGPCIVDADGTIKTAPAKGSGAYNFFINLAGPIGIPPVVGTQKLMISPYVTYVANAPYGALVAGFSQKPNPALLTDFPAGFSRVGKSGTVVAPTEGGYLFLAVNDLDLTDNEGSFVADVTSAGAN
jgi:hypothetical protein